MRQKKQPADPPTWFTPEYIAFCEAQACRFGIRYHGNERWHRACLVHRYTRQDPEIIAGPIMSASSGPKDYFKNDVIGLFQNNLEVNEVAYVVLNGVPFLICKVGHLWFDLSKPEGRVVEVMSDATVSS